jgi:hypothetical protein
VVQCDPGSLDLSLQQSEALGTIQLSLNAGVSSPCLLEHPLRVMIVNTAGIPLDLVMNPVSIATDLALPDDPIARLEWSDWCGGGSGYALSVSIGDAKAAFPIDGVPACRPDATAKLTLLARSDGPPPVTPTPTPAPGALERLYAVGETVAVQLYADAAVSGTPLCVDILREMVPAAVAGSVSAQTATCAMTNGERLRFARDGQGRVYLDGVELLLIAKDTLPQSYAYSGCNTIRSHLIPAEEPADSAAYLLVCDVSLLPRGETGTPLRIWARVRQDLLDAGGGVVGPETRCWELSRSLGPAGGFTTIPVQCWLD